MSLGGLVAYGDSDESEEETSEVEDGDQHGNSAAKSESQLVEVTKTCAPMAMILGLEAEPDLLSSGEGTADQLVVVGSVDDIEDDELPDIVTMTPFSVLKLPAPKHTTGTNIEQFPTFPTRAPTAAGIPTPGPGDNILDESDENMSEQASLLGLPIPKHDKVQPAVSEMEEDEIEDEIKKKTMELKTKAEAPPKRPSKQPVKIVIPELSQYDSDEEESPSRKTAKPTKCAGADRTGLFSLLPEPKNFAVKTTNRPLLPYTLKRPAAAPKPKPVKKPKPDVAPVKSLVVGVTDEDSDEEVEDTPAQSNFFSLVKGSRTKSATPGLNMAPEVHDPQPQQVAPPSLTGPWQQPTDVVTDTSLDTSSTVTASADLAPRVKSAEVGDGDMENYTVPYSNAGYNYSNYTVQEEEPTEIQQYLQDEEFLKLAGRRLRGQERIDLIDVQGDHQITQEELTKRITEEVVPGYSYSKKGKDNPSSQQRRKHQITYLAHQAKEREMELKNQWSQNRQSKRQTQAKYGF